MPPTNQLPDTPASNRRAANELPLDAVLVIMFWACSMLIPYLAVLVMNDGVFTYTMDDPYIHLAVAEEITRGSYGVNPHEVCAPCSSPLWPYLLAPFASLGFANLVPLLLNALFGMLTAWVALLRVRRTFGDHEGKSWAVFRAGIVIFFLLATNCIGVAFTGMEHNLQLLLAVLVVEGMLRLAEGRLPDWPFYAAMVVGPWVRYENLALTCAGFIMLFFCGKKPLALACGLASVTGLAAFSGYLAALSLSPIPSSIKAKSSFVHGDFLETMTQNLLRSLNSDRGIILALGVAILLAFLIVHRNGRRWSLFAGCMAVAGTLHLVFGAYGWVNRYEIYMLASLIWAIIGIGNQWLADCRGELKPRHSLVLPPLLMVVATPYLQGLFTLHLAANNIYEQQYQMHRFVTDFWKQPVAVNDLGYVSYRNDQYVLDLYGLASSRALEARMNGEDPEWMSMLAKENQVRLAMIYDSWFPQLPPDWKKVGKLWLSRTRITPASAQVSIYAIGAEHSDEIQSLLRNFRKTLPPGVVLETRDEVRKQGVE